MLKHSTIICVVFACGTATAVAEPAPTATAACQGEYDYCRDVLQGPTDAQWVLAPSGGFFLGRVGDDFLIRPAVPLGGEITVAVLRSGLVQSPTGAWKQRSRELWIRLAAGTGATATGDSNVHIIGGLHAGVRAGVTWVTETGHRRSAFFALSGVAGLLVSDPTVLAYGIQPTVGAQGAF